MAEYQRQKSIVEEQVEKELKIKSEHDSLKKK